MYIIVLKKTTKEQVINGSLVTETVLGDPNDTSNATVETTATTWDSSKTDYQIGDVVYLDGFWSEYTCLVAGTRGVPSVSDDWVKSGTLSQYRYRDNAPTRMSYSSVDTPLILTLNLDRTTDYLFIQNLKNVAHVKIEGLNLADEVVETIEDKDLSRIFSFRKYDCCSIEYKSENFVTLPVGGCNSYQKIRITLTQNAGKIPFVGSACVGRKWDIGCLKEYPTLIPKSTAKFELQDIDFDLNTGAKYIEGKVETWLDRGVENEVDLILMENIGELVGFVMNEFPTKNITKFLGFYKSAPIVPQNHYQKVSLDLYGIPSVRKE